MNRLEFAASVIDNVISWPVAILIIVFLLRKQLRDLIGRIRKGTIFGQDFEFGDRLELAEESTAEALANLKAKVPPPPDEPEEARVDDSAETNPSGLVIASWERLVAAIEGLHKASGLAAAQYYSVRLMLKDLAELGLVDYQFKESVLQVQDLRNKVAHGRHVPTPGEAAAYAETALDLTRALKNLHGARNRADA